MRDYSGFTYFTQSPEYVSDFRTCDARVEGDLIQVQFRDNTDPTGYFDFRGQAGARSEGVYHYRQDHQIFDDRQYLLVREDVGEQIILFGTWRDPHVVGTPKQGAWVIVLNAK